MADTPQPGGAGEPDDRPPIPFPLLGTMDMSQLLQTLRTDDPLNWDIAGQIATWVASEGRAQPAVPDGDRGAMEELVRAAQTHVTGSTGLTVNPGIALRLVSPADWATLHLDALRPVLETLAGCLNEAVRKDLTDIDPEQAAELFGAEAFGGLGAEPMAAILPVLAPTLLGLQAGSMVGYLGQHALGRYDLPLPTSDEPSICFVISNIDEFEAEWSLERDALRFCLALAEVTHAAVRTVPWLQPRLVALASEYVSGYDVDSGALEDHFGSINPGDPEALRSIARDPAALLGAMRTPGQAGVLARLQDLTGVMEGYADTVLAGIGRPLIPSYDQIHEAIARHRLERGDAGRFIEGLLGLALDREHYERGTAFCEGVVERAGLEGLDRLWEREDRVPTSAELDAPGLWLARIDLPTDPDDTSEV